jgi:hypothetical protein
LAEALDTLVAQLHDLPNNLRAKAYSGRDFTVAHNCWIKRFFFRLVPKLAPLSFWPGYPVQPTHDITVNGAPAVRITCIAELTLTPL